jgi:leucyl/phenylalanyl-tRNA--protein transferase
MAAMQEPIIPWLDAGAAFPPADRALGHDTEAPGLLAAGGELNVPTLLAAYSHGIFPWYSDGQPILWWSPDPRMVLQADRFRLHPSMRKTLRRFIRSPQCEVRIDRDFARVIGHCASQPRNGSGSGGGTWIVPDMQWAYRQLHRAGLAHSVETWIDGELAGGLYCVAIGQAVFGESMFSLARDASKIALAALVALCRQHGMRVIDCQQNTRHLASLGAAEIPRATFVEHCRRASALPAPAWVFEPLYWRLLLPDRDANQ